MNMANPELERYKRYVKKRFAETTNVLARVAAGEFSPDDLPKQIQIPEKEDEFTELLVGLKFLLEDLAEHMKEREKAVVTAKAKAEEADKHSKELEKTIRELEKAKAEIEDKAKDLEFFHDKIVPEILKTKEKDDELIELRKQLKELKGKK